MADWVTISSLATAGGTLILAVATFASVRSANRAARAAERSLLVGLRPVLVSSRLEDPGEKVGFVDGHWLHLQGGRGAAEEVDGRIYLAIPLRNAGHGLAVLHGWHVTPAPLGRAGDPVAVEAFRRLTRDLYVPAGDLGFWQGALRDPGEPLHAGVREAIATNRPLTVDLLYGDHEGGQRAITRIALIPREGGGVERLCSVSRHWYLDQPPPR